ncbi:GntR family transcriptional regulator [Sediminitomix flava]|uniref:GntR family transcriptional regulator n=1 Tax=Sediminitomix flava TaxID=379075 RepID=A0A315Z7A0_SEDFL|nr:GntR family transcriptional regulator [Sediminitomix flava]PWJ40832.1 GntR family transcriptional regulator [Sediminitomix flava]
MEFNSKKSIYLQIADLLIENILKKIWKEGERIPSVRQLAVELEVNPNTAMRTYTYLQDQGIIYNKRGIGYFISADAYSKVLDVRRKVFLMNEVPSFFKNMELLQIDWEDLKQQFQLFQS